MEYLLVKCQQGKWIGIWNHKWTALDTLKKVLGSLIIIFLMERAKMDIEELLGLDIYQIQMKVKES
jgi:hypothetical protein